jgi:hypothetical protein
VILAILKSEWQANYWALALPAISSLDAKITAAPAASLWVNQGWMLRL